MGKAIKKKHVLTEEEKAVLAEQEAEEKRRDELGIQDEFQATGRAWANWLEDNQGIAFALIGVFLVAGIGLSVMNSKGSEKMAEENQVFEELLSQDGVVESSLSSPELQNLAQLINAGRYASAGELEKAAGQYRALINSEGLLSTQAYDGLTGVLIGQKKADEALALLNTWVSKNDSGLPVALLRTAEVALSKSNKDLALKSAGRVLAEFDNQEYVKRATRIYTQLGEAVPNNDKEDASDSDKTRQNG